MAYSDLPPLTPELKSNFRQLYADTIWFGVLAGSAMAFLNIYAARIGASSLHIGLLSAGPAVINLLFTLPAGRWLEKRPLISTSFLSSVLFRLGFVVLVAIPWIVSPTAQVWGMVWITLAMSIPGTILAIAFNAMFAGVVPSEWRAHVVGRRNAMVAISLTISALVSGQILDLVIFPINYQIVFAIGAFGALMSSYHLGKIHSGNEAPIQIGRSVREFTRSVSWQRAIRGNTPSGWGSLLDAIERKTPVTVGCTAWSFWAIHVCTDGILLLPIYPPTPLPTLQC